jgi:hypothetical protein
MSISFYLSMMLLIVIGLPWTKWIEDSLRSQRGQTLLNPAIRAASRFA